MCRGHATAIGRWTVESLRRSARRHGDEVDTRNSLRILQLREVRSAMSSSTYDLWTAIGTVGAVVVALVIALVQGGVALRRRRQERKLAREKVVSLVSAWIETTYRPSIGGDYYQRSVTLHLANESDEPVFKVEVLCGIATENGVIQVGPIAAPRIIPVLPPQQEFKYDITMGILAFGPVANDAFRALVAEVGFRDHEGERWNRGFEGELQHITDPKPAQITEADDDLMRAQTGPTDNPYNPFGLVLAFADKASDEEISNSEFQALLATQAHGWKNLTEAEVSEFRDLLGRSNLPTHVWYLTPRIAYVRLIDSQSNDQSSVVPLTLVWRNRIGWTLFGRGPFQPWDVRFKPGELETDPLDGRR